MKSGTCFYAAGLLALSALCAGPARAALVLVENGVSRAPVVIFENAPPYTRRAADELAGYIEKISGARPPVLEGRPDPLPERAIWVGFQPVLTRLFPEVDFNFQYPEEILIAANENHLVIAGRDRWNPDHLVVQGRNAVIEGKQQEYGTVNAVYTFLQDRLGVRWLWPGELGEDILRRETIALEPFTHRYHPQFRQRCDIFRLSANADSRGLSHDWVRFQRLQLDSLEFPGGHVLAGWWDKYHEAHPEYFAFQPDGTRSGFPEPMKVKICQANPAVWEQWLADVAGELNEDPNRKVFCSSPNDSWNRGHCVCEDCRAWDRPDGALVRQSWQGVSEMFVSLSDRQTTFANTLARLVRERFPDRDLYVGMSAYGDAYIRAPLGTVPDDNVLVSVVAGFFLQKWAGGKVDRAPAEVHRQYFRDWAKISRNLRWRPNVGGRTGWHQGLPDIALASVSDDFRFVAENNCIGMFFDTTWEFWPTQGPLYYLMAQLAWNPHQDWQAVMDDYYRRGFGPAAGQVKAYWELLEAARHRKAEETVGYPEVYDAAFFNRAAGLLDAADAALADALEVYRRRVAFVRAGLEFTRLMVDNHALMARYRQSQGADAAAADRVRENWKQIEPLARANLMNYSFLRPGQRYVAGLHPDHP